MTCCLELMSTVVDGVWFVVASTWPLDIAAGLKGRRTIGRTGVNGDSGIVYNSSESDL